MPHNSTIIICKEPPKEAEAISAGIKSMKGQIKSCVGRRGYRTKKTGMQNLTREDLVVDDK